jgi:hypothetical protein
MAAMGLPAAFGRPGPPRKRRRTGRAAVIAGSAAATPLAVKAPREPAVVEPLLRNEPARVPWGGSAQAAAATFAGWLTNPSDPDGSDTARWAQLISSSTQRTRMRAVKDMFETVEPSAFRRARAATNPYECLGSGPFVCRSALKLVEMDALCGLIAAATTHADAASFAARVPAEMASNSSTMEFTFVDLCGGPGGFSEYLCTKGRGWGITLKIDDGCDWKIGRELSSVARIAQGSVDVTAGKANCDAAGDATPRFTVSYGADGTGNLYSVENIRHFAAEVGASVPGGVRLVVADGGFNDARNSHDQEVCALCAVCC